MRILFYTVNGKGLGHLMRALAIARAVVRQAPESHILFVTSCEDPGVVWREGFHYVKVPAPEAMPALGLGREGHRDLVHRLVRTTFSNFRPDILVVDSFAYGSVGELRQVLNGIWRRVLVSNLFLLLRDVVRYRESVSRYELLIYPFTQPEAAGHPALDGIKTPILFAGPIAGIAREDVLPRAEARSILGLPEEGRIVLVATGGGGGASVQPVLARAFETVPLLPDLGFAFLDPPLARWSSPVQWRANLRIVRRVPIAPYLGAFDAAVSTAGMNSGTELMVAGVPTVWLPLGAPSNDQEKNVRRWTERGVGITPADGSPAALADAIRRVLDPERATAIRRAMAKMAQADGASTAASAILGLTPPNWPQRRNDANGDAQGW